MFFIIYIAILGVIVNGSQLCHKNSRESKSSQCLTSQKTNQCTGDILTCLRLKFEAVAKNGLRTFPGDFLLGASTSAYQIEGAWNEDGKTENIWDHMTHYRAYDIEDYSNADVTCDSYHKYQRDVEMMRELNLDAYRFSISWTRILPTGFANEINPAGIQYYNDLIDEMLKYNIQPMVTLYHWDLPQSLQKLGGWTNPNIVDWFGDYVRIIFKNFGDRVKLWITINEPREICHLGHGDNFMAPQLNMKGIAEYMCTKNLLLAHATAYHIYNDEFKPLFDGECGITISMNWFWGDEDIDGSQQAAEDYRDFEFGQYVHPIFSETGDYPQTVKSNIAQRSEEQGYPRSRLPELSSYEIDLIKGSADFIGVNHYIGCLAYKNTSAHYPVPSYLDDLMGADIYQDPAWLLSASSWLFMEGRNLYNVITHLMEYYNNPKIYITETGWPNDEGLDDTDRVLYYRTKLNEVLDAIDKGANVQGFMAWSLMDNFEWRFGYVQKYGLYQVDNQDPNRTRTPKKSAFIYKEIARSRSVDPDYEPDTRKMWIEEGH